MWGIIHFFQAIRPDQNYFAILAKMMFLSVSILDFNNNNKSLVCVNEITNRITFS
tara:strand:+ start:382 stop:546 length:165 start_codon:yes stop_codon:yes gene_type:complete